MAQIKLYYSPGACSLAPHILLRGAGADFAFVKEVAGKFFPEFLTLNPKSRIPVLVLPIDDKHDHERVITEAPTDVVRTYEWMNWLSGTLHGKGYGGLLRPQRFSNDPAAVEGIKAKGRETIREGYQAIDEKLSSAGGRKHVHAVGDSFTVVDVYLLVLYRWSERLGVVESMEKEYPAYTALVREVSKWETMAAALEAEQIAPTFAHL